MTTDSILKHHSDAPLHIPTTNWILEISSQSKVWPVPSPCLRSLSLTPSTHCPLINHSPPCLVYNHLLGEVTCLPSPGSINEVTCRVPIPSSNRTTISLLTTGSHFWFSRVFWEHEGAGAGPYFLAIKGSGLIADPWVSKHSRDCPPLLNCESRTGACFSTGTAYQRNYFPWVIVCPLRLGDGSNSNNVRRSHSNGPWIQEFPFIVLNFFQTNRMKILPIRLNLLFSNTFLPLSREVGCFLRLPRSNCEPSKS